MSRPGSGLIILATRNPGKLREIRALLSSLPAPIHGLDEIAGIPGRSPFPEIPEIPETGETLEENALIKARTVYALTGLMTLSDDSGLEVDFLGGAPGVRSARFAGDDATYDDNNRKLLSLLSRARGPAARRARFRCVAACVGPGMEKVTQGNCHGRIADEPLGGGGFGYDPLFIPDGYDVSFASLSFAEKNAISHRRAAFSGMREFLKSLTPSLQG